MPVAGVERSIRGQTRLSLPAVSGLPTIVERQLGEGVMVEVSKTQRRDKAVKALRCSSEREDSGSTSASASPAEHVPLNTDREIRLIEDDTLGRAVFARRIAKRIVAAADEPSVVFGLAGPWGSGKTSVVYMISQLLEQEHSQQWAVAWFTPWSTSTVDSLTDEFYRSVASAMPGTKKGGKAREQLIAMAPAVAGAVLKAGFRALIDRNLGEGATADIGGAFTDAVAEGAGQLKFDPDPFVARFDKASDAIKAAGRNVLVVVDDVDRLHADELLTVLKAVRLLGRFDRVHYLLAYDEETLLDVLESSDIAHGERGRANAYLEKIVQYPYMLPPLQEAQIDAALRQSLTGLAQTHRIRLTDEASPWTDPVEIAIDQIPEMCRRRFTLRTINRLTSQADVLLSLVDAGEIDFVDAVLITYLRLHHHAIYQRLPRWRADLVSSPSLQTIYFSDREDKVDWTQRISGVLGENADPDEVKSLVRLLTAIYPRVGLRLSARTLKSCPASSPDYFARYLAFTIPVGDVADADIRLEVDYLCQRGELRASSVIAAMLASPSSHGLLVRKFNTCLDVVDKTASAQAAQVVRYLSMLSRRNGPVVRPALGYERMLNVLAERAILAASTPQEARQFVDAYTDDYGIRYVATVLAGTRQDLDSEAGRGNYEQVVAARAGLRDRITAACVADLSSTIDLDNVAAVTIMRIAGFLDNEQWDELASTAKQLIADGATPWELAGRFVGQSPHLDEAQTLYWNIFERVVPSADWHHRTIPAIDPPDNTSVTGAIQTPEEDLAERIAYAANAMKAKVADLEIAPATTDQPNN